MPEDLDYHVGLMRGYLLAHNAPTQILHALDILLSDYRSKAGEVIGSKTPPPPSSVRQTMEEVIEVVKIKPEATKKKHFWDKEDDEILRRMYEDEGQGPRKIADALNRTTASISTRISVRGLKRKAA